VHGEWCHGPALQFVTDAFSERFILAELCERCRVSRRIDYRCSPGSPTTAARLADRSRRPHTWPTHIGPVLAEPLCEFRPQHPD
jgi:hypothetical protein